MKAIVIIPARLDSSRLSQKVVADIGGKTMLEHSIERALETGIEDILVAYCSKEIESIIENAGVKGVITDKNLPSGTDRVFAALQTLNNIDDFDIIVNLQSDMPFVDPQGINKVIEVLKNDKEVDIATAAAIIKDKADIQNPNVAKIALAKKGNNYGHGLYFSRSAIPHNDSVYYHHFGLYAYKREALQKFVQSEPSYLEKVEKLEQLRALENGMKIGVTIVDEVPISVDVLEDLEKARKYYATK